MPERAAVTLAVIIGSDWLSVTVVPAAMVMVLLPPAALESKIAWRREPAPLSLPLVTSKFAAHAVQGDRQVPSNRPAVSARRRFGRQSFIADLPQRFANRETSAGECANAASTRGLRPCRA